MKRLKLLLENSFGFSAKEAIGFLALMMLNLILCGLILIKPWQYFDSSHHKNNTTSLDSLITAWQNKIRYDSIQYWQNLQAFNPNQANIEQWQNIGFNSYEAERIVKVSLSPKGIRDFQHFKRIYGIDTVLAEKLKPYLVFNARQQVLQTSTNENIEKRPAQLIRFNLNEADTNQFKTVHGIGSKLSKRIIAYRQQLGGFVNEGQLFEVYKLDSTVAERILKKFYIDKNFTPKQIDINSASISDLTAHPYIEYKTAQIVINYRKQHGPYQSAKDLLSVKVLNKEWIEKISPYFSFTE